MEYKYRFSVFTATFNRCQLLRNVYEDLLHQTFKDFEWVVVNDGSTDRTDEVMHEIISEGKLNIQYIKKSGGGKHTAWREATKVFLGRYIVGADDDDNMPVDALEIFHTEWCNLEKQANYDEFWEVRARVSRDGKNIHGKALPQSPFDSSYIDINFKYKFGTLEMQGCRKVEVLRNEAAVPEHFVYDSQCSNFAEKIRWIRASRKYKTRFIDKIVRVYNESEVSLSSSNKGQKRSSKRTYNGLVTAIYDLNENHDLLSCLALLRVVVMFNYFCAALSVKAHKHIHNPMIRLLAYVEYPLSWMLFKVRG
jgi:glycosyltransferase involved in cell wall biosynthesis